MMRVVIENVFFFMLPTLLYVAWFAYSENVWPGLGSLLRQAPLGKLFVSGAFLMLATLMMFSTKSGNRPDEAYVPPSFEGGKLHPGHPADQDTK